MITVNCRTNLDLRNEKWPKEMPAVPSVGDFIESAQIWQEGFKLVLEVCAVTWRIDCGRYYPEIELRIPKHREMSIRAFYEWYAPKVGRSVGAFI